MDETAHVGESAPAAPEEAGPGDATPPPTAPEPPAAPFVEPAPEAAEPAPGLPPEQVPAEPVPAGPVAAPTGDSIATAEIEAAGAVLQLPAALTATPDLEAGTEAAPADPSFIGESEAAPLAQDAPPGRLPLVEPVPEPAPPPPIALVAPPPPEPEAPQVWVKANGEEHPSEALPAAAWVAPKPLPPPQGEEATEPGTGRQESENQALEATADESLPSSAAAPATAPSEPPETPDSLPLPVASATPLTKPEPQQQTAGEEVRPDPRDAAPVALQAPEETSTLPHREPPSPADVHEPQSHGVAAGTPAVLAAAAPSTAVVPAAAWIFPAEAEPALPAPEAPQRALPPEWAAPAPPSRRPALPPALPYVRLALRATAIATAGLIVTVLALTVLYRWVNPPISTLMVGRSLAGTGIERTWRPLERISPHLLRAVILSEDGSFCRHRGVDWSALEEAIESDRGGSTITMQVVKNLFLWPSRSYVRKVIEIGLAYLVEALWPKRRILEIYLNIAEWGDGVFGAEAAAQVHFGKRAARLTAEEAALLAAVLPNPIERTAGAPSEVTSRIASRLATRMRTSRADFSCVPVPRLEPRKAPQKEPMRSPQRFPERLPERFPDKPPLVQGPRMTL